VQWRRGNDHRDRYEIVYRQQYVAVAVVTRAGWKWAEPNPKIVSHRALSARYVWSPKAFPTWQEAVAAYARRYRTRQARRGYAEPVRLPENWIAMRRDRRVPWVPRPVHDDFEQETPEP
jgi:hypothetical protein